MTRDAARDYINEIMDEVAKIWASDRETHLLGNLSPPGVGSCELYEHGQDKLNALFDEYFTLLPAMDAYDIIAITRSSFSVRANISRWQEFLDTGYKQLQENGQPDLDRMFIGLRK